MELKDYREEALVKVMEDSHAALQVVRVGQVGLDGARLIWVEG